MFTIPIGMMSQSDIINLLLTIAGAGTYTYDGTTRTLSVTTNNDSVYYFFNGSSVTGSQSDSITNAGTLTITLAKDTTNSPNSQISTSGSTTITINQATLTLTISENETQTYTGSVLSRTITPSNNSISYLIDGVAGTGIRTYSKTEYGDHSFTLASNNSNYITNQGGALLYIEDTPHIEVVHGSQTPYINITNNTTISGYTNSETNMSISILASFDSDDTGILYEAGGTGAGIVIYIYNKYLYIQGGDGTAGDSHMYELSYLLEENSQTTTYTNKHIDISFKKNDHIVLFLDHIGKLISSFGNPSNFHESNDLGIGKVHTEVADNNGGWTNDDSGVFTGTISYAKVYHNLNFSGQVITMLFSNTTTTYNSSSQSITITPSNTTISYKINGTAGTGVRTYSQTNADTYNITLESNDDSYILDTSSTIFTINKATLTLTITGDATQTHTGSQLSRTVTPSVTTSDNANTIEYLKDGSVTTGVSYITRTSVGTNTDTFSSNNDNYVTNISSSSLTVEASSTSYTYYKFLIPASGATRIDYIKFMTAGGSTVATSLHAYNPTSLSKWRNENVPNGPHQESGEGWFLNNEDHYYVFKNNTSSDITNYDLKMISHPNRMPQKWIVYGSNTNGSWNYIRTVPSSGTFNEGSNTGSPSTSTGLRYHYQNGNKWFNTDVRPNNSGNGYIGSLSNSDFDLS